MILEWFNAREAVEVGSSLANYLVPPLTSPLDARTRGGSSGNIRVDVQKLLQRAIKEAGSLKLNLYKRAKLLGSFKWTLLERGFDREFTEELTRALLLQLSGERARAAFADSFRIGGAATADGVSAASTSPQSKRLAALLADADKSYRDGDHARAVEQFQQALALDPRNAIACVKLGASLCNLGRYQEGEQQLRRAIEIKANCPGAQLSLGTLLRAKGEFAASETALRRAVKQDPRDPEALAELGLTLGAEAKLGDARQCFEKALRLKPRHAGALCGLGWLASKEGRFEDAEKLYRSALETEPLKAAAWAPVPELRRMTLADKDWIEGVERALASGVQPLEELKLRFAMGKYFDDTGNFPRAFTQFQRANELYKQVTAPYDSTARERFVDDMIRVYTRQHLMRPGQSASDSQKPVFVVGMMRSGTSLVEQIIASHPAAAAAGELDFWTSTVHKHPELRREPPNTDMAGKWKESYLKVLSRHSGSARRVVDKATFNSDHLGPIHSIFPRARIIYLRRDPADTCLSCYFQYFANAASFTTDLSDLAHYYRQHHRLMAHWRETLPGGVLLEVPYEGLVADQETWSRRIIEFIGLEWDSRCLEFHKAERPVLTASSWQVRQRMYSSSVGRWCNYERFIGPLLPLRKLN
jgi:Flp pilus assembly protein TadD